MSKKKIFLFLSFVFLVLLYFKSRSYIGVNIPSANMFDEYLQRDLDTYFKNKNKDMKNLDYVLLSEKVSQTGLSYPKYYLWVTLQDDEQNTVAEYAVRVSAMDKEDFYITDSFTKEEIEANPDIVKGIFPEIIISRMNTFIK